MLSINLKVPTKDSYHFHYLERNLFAYKSAGQILHMMTQARQRRRNRLPCEEMNGEFQIYCNSPLRTITCQEEEEEGHHQLKAMCFLIITNLSFSLMFSKSIFSCHLLLDENPQILIMPHNKTEWTWPK